MKIPGWAYILVGVIVSGFSAYAYKYFPKNGEPNPAMALFFFVGMIFILVGIVKIFFRKLDVETDAVQIPKQADTSHANKVQSYIDKAYSQTNNKNAQHNHNHAQAQHHTQVHHTSEYAKSHPFSQHNSQQSQQHNSPNNNAHNQQMPSIINCVKCGTKNYSTSNYCHKCGNRIK